jgi:dihydrofolate reductase
MRRIVTFNRVTADGYFSGDDGNLSWAVPDAELDQTASAGMPETDMILFGRRTYEMFAAFWPRALDDPAGAPDPHNAGIRSPGMRAFATFLNDTAKRVFSKTLKDASWKNTQLLRGLEPAEIDGLKHQPGKDIIIFGSGSIVSQLTRHGLIDEYQFVVSPLLLGSGRPLIAGLPTGLKLELLECRPYRSGNVMLRYAHRPGA